MPLLEILIVLVLVLINAVLAAAELSIVSSRPARLKTLADRGNKGAKAAMRLAEDPGRFLSTVQIGITLIGILAGAFSGASLGDLLGETLREAGLPTSVAHPLGYTAVVVAITYVSLVIGELIPKRLALQNAEPLACILAPLMIGLSKVSAPMVWLLDASTRAVLTLLGRGGSRSSSVTDEEIRAIITEAETAGVLEQLGFKNVKVYDSSWLGYGNKLDAPAENETVFNVGALNGRIAAMQKRIDTLEKELAASKK